MVLCHQVKNTTNPVMRSILWLLHVSSYCFSKIIYLLFSVASCSTRKLDNLSLSVIVDCCTGYWWMAKFYKMTRFDHFTKSPDVALHFIPRR